MKEWYSHAGKTAFETAQSTKKLGKNEAKAYMRAPGPESLNILTGPVKNPQVDTLAKGTYLDIARSFPDNSSLYLSLRNVSKS